MKLSLYSETTARLNELVLIASKQMFLGPKFAVNYTKLNLKGVQQ